jgi:hypothetical protein
VVAAPPLRVKACQQETYAVQQISSRIPLLDRQVGGLLAFENPASIDTGEPICDYKTAAVAQKCRTFGKGLTSLSREFKGAREVIRRFSPQFGEATSAVGEFAVGAGSAVGALA